jgi:hypothetical protein
MRVGKQPATQQPKSTVLLISPADMIRMFECDLQESGNQYRR